VLAAGAFTGLFPSQACDAAGGLRSDRVVLSRVVIGTTPSSGAVPARCDFSLCRFYASAARGAIATRAGDGLPSSRDCCVTIPLPLPRGVPRRLHVQIFGAFRGLRHNFNASPLLCPLTGSASRGCRIRSMLRACHLLPPKGLSTLGSGAGRFPPAPPACYRATWQLPGPDFHRQADTSFSTWVTQMHHLPCRGWKVPTPTGRAKLPLRRVGFSPPTAAGFAQRDMR
jgi:hypothetical protein